MDGIDKQCAECVGYEKESSVARHTKRLVTAAGVDVKVTSLIGTVRTTTFRLSQKSCGYHSRVVLTGDSIHILDLRPESDMECRQFCLYFLGSHDHAENGFLFHRQIHQNKGKILQPMSSLVAFALILSHKQHIYVLRGITKAENFTSAEHRYCIESDERVCCNKMPMEVINQTADVVLHDGVINIFTSTERLRYADDTDTGKVDQYRMEDELVEVFLKGRQIWCVLVKF